MLFHLGSRRKSMVSKEELFDRLENCTLEPGNETCAECHENDPTWASLIILPASVTGQKCKKSPVKMGVLCCKHCISYHLELGRDVSAVKNINTADDWTEEEVEALETSGNECVGGIFEANLCSQERFTINALTGREQETALEKLVFKKYMKRAYFSQEMYDFFKLSQEPKKEPKRGRGRSSITRDDSSRSVMDDDSCRSTRSIRSIFTRDDSSRSVMKDDSTRSKITLDVFPLSMLDTAISAPEQVDDLDDPADLLLLEEDRMLPAAVSIVEPHTPKKPKKSTSTKSLSSRHGKKDKDRKKSPKRAVSPQRRLSPKKVHMTGPLADLFSFERIEANAIKDYEKNSMRNATWGESKMVISPKKSLKKSHSKKSHKDKPKKIHVEGALADLFSFNRIEANAIKDFELAKQNAIATAVIRSSMMKNDLGKQNAVSVSAVKASMEGDQSKEQKCTPYNDLFSFDRIELNARRDYERNKRSSAPVIRRSSSKGNLPDYYDDDDVGSVCSSSSRTSSGSRSKASRRSSSHKKKHRSSSKAASGNAVDFIPEDEDDDDSGRSSSSRTSSGSKSSHRSSTQKKKDRSSSKKDSGDITIVEEEDDGSGRSSSSRTSTTGSKSSSRSSGHKKRHSSSHKADSGDMTRQSSSRSLARQSSNGSMRPAPILEDQSDHHDGPSLTRCKSRVDLFSLDRISANAQKDYERSKAKAKCSKTKIIRRVSTGDEEFDDVPDDCSLSSHKPHRRSKKSRRNNSMNSDVGMSRRPSERSLRSSRTIPREKSNYNWESHGSQEDLAGASTRTKSSSKHGRRRKSLDNSNHSQSSMGDDSSGQRRYVAKQMYSNACSYG